MAAATRLYFFDNLRVLVIFLVVVLHSIMCYMAYAPAWWYVVDKQHSMFLLMLVLLIDVPIMQAMFFISGYFALPSLLRRGPGTFLRDKFVRIGIPWIFGALVLAPPTTYMILFSRHVPMGFRTFWRTQFWGPLYQQSVYWYLGVLFALFALLALAYAVSADLRTVQRQNSAPSCWLFVGFLVIMAVPFILLNRSFDMDTWSNNYLFVYQPLRVPLYIGYFVLGILAERRRWFTAEGYKPGGVLWGSLCVMSAGAYLYLRMAGVGAARSPALPLAAAGVLFNVYCLAALLAAVALFRRGVNGAGPTQTSLAASSYGIYYVHPLILFPLAYLLTGVSWPLAIKAVLLVGVTFILSWAVSALLLRRAPLLRRMF